MCILARYHVPENFWSNTYTRTSDSESYLHFKSLTIGRFKEESPVELQQKMVRDSMLISRVSLIVNLSSPRSLFADLPEWD